MSTLYVGGNNLVFVRSLGSTGSAQLTTGENSAAGINLNAPIVSSTDLFFQDGTFQFNYNPFTLIWGPFAQNRFNLSQNSEQGSFMVLHPTP